MSFELVAGQFAQQISARVEINDTQIIFVAENVSYGTIFLCTVPRGRGLSQNLWESVCVCLFFPVL